MQILEATEGNEVEEQVNEGSLNSPFTVPEISLPSPSMTVSGCTSKVRRTDDGIQELKDFRSRHLLRGKFTHGSSSNRKIIMMIFLVTENPRREKSQMKTFKLP